MEKIEKKVEELECTNSGDTRFEKAMLDYEKRDVEIKILKIENELSMFDYDCRSLEVVSDDLLENFEFSNVIRLGLVKEEKDFYTNTQSLEIPTESEYQRSYINVDFDIDVESDVKYYLTELGELFFNACKEKQFKSN